MKSEDKFRMIRELHFELLTPVMECKRHLELHGWDIEKAKHSILEEINKPSITYSNPVIHYDESTGEMHILLTDTYGNMFYRKGNVLHGTWEDIEKVV